MIEFNNKKLKVVAWIFLATGVIANVTLPYVAHFCVNYYDKVQPFSIAFANVLKFHAEFSNYTEAYFLYNLHLTIFGIISSVALGTTSLASGPGVAYSRYTGLLTGGLTMILVTFWGYEGMLTSKGSTSGLGVIFIPFYAVIIAFPATVIGWQWGRLRFKKKTVL